MSAAARDQRRCPAHDGRNGSVRQPDRAHLVQDFLRACGILSAAEPLACLGRLGVELLDQAAPVVAVAGTIAAPSTCRSVSRFASGSDRGCRDHDLRDPRRSIGQRPHASRPMPFGPMARGATPALAAPPSAVTTAAAPITAPSPMVTPGMTKAPLPIQTSWPIRVSPRLTWSLLRRFGEACPSRKMLKPDTRLAL